LLQNILDFIGNDPFIYISFGSAANIARGPKYLQDKFIQAFTKMKDMKFVWKYEGERTPEIPSNVFIAKWMPQQDILGILIISTEAYLKFAILSCAQLNLAQPNIVAFITHGGLLGIQEAVFHAVPMIAMPVFAEQDYNSERLERMGRGLTLDLVSFTASELENAIHRIYHEKRFAKSDFSIKDRKMY